MELSNAYKEIFKDENFQGNSSKINGQFKNNELINEVISFIAKIKKTLFAHLKNNKLYWLIFGK